MPETLLELFTLRNLADIVIVSYFFYKVSMMIRDTRAIQLLKGLLVLLLVAYLSNKFRLQTLSWLLTQFQTALIVALPVVFQPELRKGLERIGQGTLFTHQVLNKADFEKMTEEIIKAIRILSREQIGALLVLERETGLSDYADSGVCLNADVSSELLQNIFFPKAALHDGATIIRGNKIFAAGCFLPLSEDSSISKSLGTRHRAALGLSEQSDAFIIVVSEETGIISVMEEGKMTRYLNDFTLREMLLERFRREEANRKVTSLWRSAFRRAKK